MMKILLLFVLLIPGFLHVNGQRLIIFDAMDLVKKNSKAIGLSENGVNDLLISDSYNDNVSGLELVYIQQTYLGVPVYNQIMTLAFKNGQLVSKTGKPFEPINKLTTQKTANPPISAETAAITAISSKAVDFKEELIGSAKGTKIDFGKPAVAKANLTAELIWLHVPGSQRVALAWQINFSPKSSADNWLIRVDAVSNQVVDESNLTVFCNFDQGTEAHEHAAEPTKTIASVQRKSPGIVNGASYRVIPYPAESPLHPGGSPAIRTNPWTLSAGNAVSLKWHSDGINDYNYTRGNNVWAYHDRLNMNNPIEANSAASFNPADPLSFDFLPDFTISPTETTPVQNQQFNITNLFYWNNIIHDLTYQYGFDEAAGNFQANNQGRGGLGNDFVRAEAQDGSGGNNANFNTPADGGNGVMQMYLWNGSPQRDGDVDNGIIIHEFSHGISNRLTGGPAQAGCLGNNEQMGEGWSDFYALMATHNWSTAVITDGFNSPRGIGTYAQGQPITGTGIRPRKYCTNFLVNEATYATLPQQAVPHGVGFVWCTMLWDMTWEIIQTAGISPNLFDANGTGGNVVALKLVTQAMKLQPCSPGFIDGRNAILMADQLLYNGQYRCAIMAAFARRGLGFDASQGSSNSKTDGVAGFSTVESALTLTQNTVAQEEGLLVTYTNKVAAGPCGAISNYLLTDTLPSNVTYVSGGTYNTVNRVVSFPVNIATGQTQNYVFTVRINMGSWFPTINLFEDLVSNTSIPSTWNANSTTLTNWIATNAKSHTAPNSYYSLNSALVSDQKLSLANPINLGTNPPALSFWHWFSTESTYDGGVLEASIDGGIIWTDMAPHIISGKYNGTMSTSSNSPIGGRQAWTGNSNGFIKTKVNLDAFANRSLKIRFRSTTDDGTSGEGWYIDDIAFKKEALAEIRSNLFSGSGVLVNTTDTFTVILESSTCPPLAVSLSPANVTSCTGSDATFMISATGRSLSYQWQVSTNAGVTFTNIASATNPSLTLINTSLAMNGYQYRVVINGACTQEYVSSAATLAVNSPVSIVSIPASFTACASSPANFSIATTGSVLSYQWEESVNGGSFVSLTNTGIYSGVNSPVLNISALTSSMNGNTYRVVVNGGACASLISPVATLNVHPQPAVSITAANMLLNPSINTTIISTVAPAGNYSYQWYRNTVLLPNSTSSSLPVNVDGIGEYSVVVTTNNGCSVQSNLLNLQGSISDQIFIYPNPNSGKFQVRFYQSVSAGTTARILTVYDAKGSKIYTGQFPAGPGYTRMDVNISNAQSGIYMVELREMKGTRLATGKILVL